MLKRVGPYTLIRLVGRGGLGVVYHAVDTRSGTSVALKLLNRPAEDTVAARRLGREFRALRDLEHRNIVRVLDAGAHEEIPYLVMEFVDGLPLRSWLDASYDDPDWAPRPPPAPRDESVSVSLPGAPSEPPPVPAAGGSISHSDSMPGWSAGDEPDSVPGHLRVRPEQGAAPVPELLPVAVRAGLNRPLRIGKLRDVIAQLADGLAFIHARGLVHRDLKPSNILVADGGCAKLVDFGLVKVSGSGSTTATGHVVGTYRYMSPEQARSGQVDGRSDLYGLGSVLYEMLCGHPPFMQQQTAALLGAIVHQLPPPPQLLNPEVDPGLARIAVRLLLKNPDDRFQSAEEVARRLRGLGRPEDEGRG